MSISRDLSWFLVTRFITMTSLSTKPRAEAVSSVQFDYTFLNDFTFTLREAISQSTTALNHSQRHISIQEPYYFTELSASLPGHFATS
jgi:hypothetical protein